MPPNRPIFSFEKFPDVKGNLYCNFGCYWGGYLSWCMRLHKFITNLGLIPQLPIRWPNGHKTRFLCNKLEYILKSYIYYILLYEAFHGKATYTYKFISIFHLFFIWTKATCFVQHKTCCELRLRPIFSIYGWGTAYR